MSVKTGKILAIDDNEDILFALKLLLKNHFESITTLNNPDQIPESMKKDDKSGFIKKSVNQCSCIQV